MSSCTTNNFAVIICLLFDIFSFSQHPSSGMSLLILSKVLIFARLLLDRDPDSFARYVAEATRNNTNQLNVASGYQVT